MSSLCARAASSLWEGRAATRRWFKLAIVAATLVVAAALIAAAPRGRYLVVSLADRARRVARQAAGVPPERSAIDAEWARYRKQSIVDTQREFQKAYAEIDPPLQRLMKYAGNDPETGLLRWGNFTQTLLLPSKVFLPDDAGRSYRLRPRTRSVWLRNLTIQHIPLTFFLVPDGPDLSEAMRDTTAVRVDGSVQTTNSWGFPRARASALGRPPRHRAGRLVHARSIHQ